MDIVTTQPRDDLFIAATPVAESLDRAAAEHGSSGVVFPHEAENYPALAARADRMAKGLIGLGVGPGDKVGILLPQGLDYLALLFAVTKVGAVAVPINARFKTRELGHVVSNSEMRALFLDHTATDAVDHLALLRDVFPELARATAGHLEIDSAPCLKHLVTLGKSTPPVSLTSRQSFESAAAAVDEEELQHRRHGVRIRDTAVIMYTSGTTSAPKGALISHEALTRVGAMVASLRLFLTPEDRLWAPLPLFHIGGVAFAVACCSSGATYCHTGAFEPTSALRLLAGQRCTVALATFETIWMAILSHPDFEKADLSDLRLIFNVGVPERLREMQERIPHAPQVSGFGSTEACSFLTLGLPTDPLEARLHTCGTPLPGQEVRIVDPETGEELPSGELGEIRYRGWAVFDGYYREPTLTAEVLDHEGWFSSGDMGTLDDHGRLTFVTRLKDMLKVGGENVAAAEIEGYLLTHPAVLIAQVVAAPDARYTEVPAAFVQLRPDTDATEQDLIEYCLGRIATFKVPRYVRFVDDWPMSGTKIKKYELRTRIAAELREQGITEAPKLRAAEAQRREVR